MTRYDLERALLNFCKQFREVRVFCPQEANSKLTQTLENLIPITINWDFEFAHKFRSKYCFMFTINLGLQFNCNDGIQVESFDFKCDNGVCTSKLRVGDGWRKEDDFPILEKLFIDTTEEELSKMENTSKQLFINTGKQETITLSLFCPIRDIPVKGTIKDTVTDNQGRELDAKTLLPVESEGLVDFSKIKFLE